MGTSALIFVEGHDAVKVYKHFDGDPDATLPWLTDFNAEFSEQRGDDPEYKMAQLLRSSARDAGKYNLDDSRFTGWGVVPMESNIGPNYAYLLKYDGTVEWLDGSDQDLSRWPDEDYEREVADAPFS